MVASVLGATGSPETHARLRELWRSPTRIECDGELAIEPADLARGVTMTGDPSALPWLVLSLDDDDTRAPVLRPQQATILAFRRLPVSVREELLPSLLAKLVDREYASQLAADCVRAGIFAKSPFDEAPVDAAVDAPVAPPLASETSPSADPVHADKWNSHETAIRRPIRYH